MKSLKRLAGALPYPLLLRLIYFWYWARDRRRESAIRKRLGIPLLSEIDLAQYKTSDTLCILASGASINEITAERWAAMAKMDTVGFNFWLFHPFVPRLYFFESLIPQDYLGRYELYLQAASRRAIDYVETLKVVTNLAPGFACPPEWQRSLYTVEPVPVPARTVEEFRAGLQYLQRKGMFGAQARIGRLFKQASTVTSLISLGVAMRYRRIILCGIDLRHSQYFFQDPQLYPDSATVEFMPREQPHLVEIATPWYLPLTQTIPVIRDVVLDPLGIEILVESKSSALWPALPEWSQ